MAVIIFDTSALLQSITFSKAELRHLYICCVLLHRKIGNENVNISRLFLKNSKSVTI